jgi:5S rRNA maturation endonuclease (ribonuclease M5)
VLDCKKGCSFNDIVRSAGLKSEDMFLSNSYGTAGKYTKIEKPLEQQPQQPRNVPETKKDIDNRGLLLETREHIYRNADNSIFGKKEVKKYENGDKNGIWHKFNPGNNSFSYGLNGEKAPPYNLNAVANSNKCVFVVEGEKDVDTLAKLGFVGTSSPHGAGAKWNPDHNQYFKGKDVVVLTDNDDVGRKYGKNVADNLSTVTKSLKVIPSEVLAQSIGLRPTEKMDITDIYEGLQRGLAQRGMPLEKVTQAVHETIPKQLRNCYGRTENYKRDIYLSTAKTSEFCRRTDNNNREMALSAPQLGENNSPSFDM